jgi:hypothetical protein
LKPKPENKLEESRALSNTDVREKSNEFFGNKSKITAEPRWRAAARRSELAIDT